MKKFAAALAFSLFGATAAFAGDITLSAPLHGAALNENQVDMSVYYEEADAGYTVVATYVARDRFNPSRLTMTLQDGESVSFGLPGEPQAYYTFARAGSDVSVSVAPVGTQFASR